ncbi:MAG TPA: acylneuraminate cytidylyltransferase family protein [Sulfurovum sp.]|nr:acylneuraminate cytidylyltransferase family protein [Sulfurovum sp.]
MKILGLIPARGGSKGIPGKNIKLLLGKPLIAYTIEQVKASNLLDRVILSTDDPKIAEVAKAHGLDVPFMRPDALARDSSGSLGVVQHALEFFEAQGEVFDAVCLLQVTSPYRPEGVIDEAIALFIKEKPDSLVSVRKVPDEFNPHWTFEIEKNNRLKISTGEEKIIPRRQELPPTYHRDGAIYITSTDTIQNKGSLLGDDIIAFPIDSPKLINIDTMDDWNEAEAFYRSLEDKD